jgi:hypothetical protein
MRARKIRKSRKRIIALGAVLTVIGVVGTAAAFGAGVPGGRDGRQVQVRGNRVTVPVAGGRVVVDAASPAVRGQADDGRAWQLSAPAAGTLGPAAQISVHGDRPPGGTRRRASRSPRPRATDGWR